MFLTTSHLTHADNRPSLDHNYSAWSASGFVRAQPGFELVKPATLQIVLTSPTLSLECDSHPRTPQNTTFKHALDTLLYRPGGAAFTVQALEMGPEIQDRDTMCRNRLLHHGHRGFRTARSSTPPIPY